MSKAHTRSRLVAAAVAAAACLLPTLAACGGASTSAGSQTTIRFLGHTGLQASMDPIIADFEAANPSIKVQVQYSPAGPTYGQTLVTQVQGGNAPDVFFGNGGTGATESLIPMAKAGKLLDLSDQAWASTIPAAAKDMYTVDGKTYGLLMDVAPHGILYKTSTFDSLGLKPPTTFDDVLQICTKARKDNKYGISLAGQTAGYAAEIIAASLVYADTPDWNTQRVANQTTFAQTAGWQETLKRFQQMRDAQCFQPGAESASTPQSFQPMTAGQTLMTIVPSGALGSVAAGKPDEWAMAPFPGDSTAKTRVAVGYQDGLAISAKTKNKDAAVAFLNYVAGPGAATRAKMSGTVTLADAKAGKFSTSLSGFAAAFKADQTVARPHGTWPGGCALNALNTAVVASMTGQSSTDAALTTVDQAWGK